jgi:hypothetical protein
MTGIDTTNVAGGNVAGGAIAMTIGGAGMTPAAQRRDYAAFGSCLMAAIAGCIVAGGVITNWHAEYKLAGLEWLLLGPMALVINAFGIGLAATALSRRSDRGWAVTGLVTNSPLPILVIAMFFVALTHGR